MASVKITPQPQQNQNSSWLDQTSLLAITVALIIASLIIRFRMKKSKKVQQKVEEVVETAKDKLKKNKNQEEAAKPKGAQPSLKQLIKQENQTKAHLKAAKKSNPNHPDYFNAFKGFAGAITDFDFDLEAKYAAVSSTDKTIKVFRLSATFDSHTEFPYTLQKVDFYNPVAISISTHARYIAVAVDGANTVQIYEYKDNSAAQTEESKIKSQIRFVSQFESSIHKNQIQRVYINDKATFVVTAAFGDDTMIKTWSLKGENIFNFNTSQLKTNKVSRGLDQRFFGVAAWTSNAELLEARLNKDGTLKDLYKAMNLTGHKQAILDVAVDQISEHAVSLSKDKTIKLWNINVRYELKEDTKTLGSIELAAHPDFKDILAIQNLALYNYNGDNLMAISHQNSIEVYSWNKQKIIQKITDAHIEGAFIGKIVMAELGKALTIISSGEDGRVNIWKVRA